MCAVIGKLISLRDQHKLCIHFLFYSALGVDSMRGDIQVRSQASAKRIERRYFASRNEL